MMPGTAKDSSEFGPGPTGTLSNPLCLKASMVALLGATPCPLNARTRPLAASYRVKAPSEARERRELKALPRQR
jgi:hypothetical protein